MHSSQFFAPLMSVHTDRHIDVQHETIIPHHYRVVGYKNVIVGSKERSQRMMGQ